MGAKVRVHGVSNVRMAALLAEASGRT